MSKRTGNGEPKWWDKAIEGVAGSGLVRFAIGLVMVVSAYFVATGVPATLADAVAVRDDVTQLKNDAREDRERLDEIEVGLSTVQGQLDVISLELHDLSRIRSELQRSIERGIKAGVREAIERAQRGP